MPQQETGTRRLYLADIARAAGVSQTTLEHYLARARERAQAAGLPARLGDDLPLPDGREDTWRRRLYWSDPGPVLSWAGRHAARRRIAAAERWDKQAGGRDQPGDGGGQEKTGPFGGHGGRTASHGTYGGYMMHVLYKVPFPEGTPPGSTGLPPCGCRDANTAYKEKYRKRKLAGAGKSPGTRPRPVPVTFRPPPDDPGGDHG